ncbi:EamA family transporter [Variovorax sp. J22P168]|uniref:DMT family transporter n=1 Tax=Variovorax jilinensis TaxID=3053513 RepID=UPI0025757DB2|nr:EamA family transporter [Variovorax sp. J22P168]MDM0011764.1 EamA family transporter [Variovorax sp. J22P168]
MAPRASRAWLIDLVLLGALWGASFLFMRIGAAEFGALPTAAVRVGVAMLFLLPLLLLRGQWAALRQHWKPALSIGILNSGLPFAFFAFALLTLTSGLGAVLNATVPMFGALVAWALFNDRPDGSRILGLVIGFTGVAMLAGRSAGFHSGADESAVLWAIGACLAACICYAFSANLTRRYLSGVPALATATGSQVGATLALALPAAWLWPTQMPSLRAWLALVALGTACTGLAYILFFRLIERAGPARALTVTFLVPVFAIFYGVVFLGEHVTAWMLLCAVVIVCGVALSTGLVKLGRRAAAR